MFDQRLHRWVVAILLAQLDRQAFAQIPRADAGRIEFLQDREHRFDVLGRRAEPLGGLAQIRRQVTRLVHQIDQILPDHALRGSGESHRQLLGEMAAERDLGGHEGFKIVAVVIRRAAAPFGIGGRRGVLRGARGGFGRLLGKHVVEAGVQRLLDLGAAAEIAVQPLFLDRLEIVAASPVGRSGGVAGTAIEAGTRVVAVGEFRAFRGRFAPHRRLGAVIGALEQRITLQFLLDKGRQVEIRQLQQLDRLHQLRRHHQRLRLAEL